MYSLMDQPETRLRRTASAPGYTVLGCMLANLVSSTPVVNATFGLFLVPISQEFHWPRSRVSAVLIIVALCCSASYSVVGRLADRWGVKRLAIVGNLVFACSVAAVSFADDTVLRTYLLFALLGMTSAIPSTMLFSKLISGWYVERRGLMLGIAAGLGNGIGSTLMPILAHSVIVSHGWRAGYVALGVVTLLVGLPSILLLLRDVPTTLGSQAAIGRQAIEPPSGLTAQQAMRTPQFWIVLAMMALGAGSLTALFAHVVPMLMDRGIPSGTATLTLAAFALTGSGWQLILGTMLDRTNGPRVMTPFFLAAIPGLAIMGVATSPGWLVVGALLTGLGLGTDYGAMPYLVGQYFGLRAFGAICGMIYSINVIVLGTTPFLMDLVYDRTGSYGAALVGIAVCLLLCAMLMLILPDYRRTTPARA